MTELTFPAFPARALATAGAVLLALVAAAVAVNGSGPDLAACARAAAQVMSARGYSVGMMELAGPGAVGACRGLSSGQYAQALLQTYQIQYGGRLARTPVSDNMPPPSYKSLSAISESRARQ